MHLGNDNLTHDFDTMTMRYLNRIETMPLINECLRRVSLSDAKLNAILHLLASTLAMVLSSVWLLGLFGKWLLGPFGSGF